MFRNFFHALAFLSILPLNPKGVLEPAEMGRFPAYYPLAGLVLGLFSVLFALIFNHLFPAIIMAVLLTTLQIVLTRGFHLDALADTADAVLSHKSVEKKLEILKDCHMGTFGVAAIVLSVILKIALIASLAFSVSQDNALLVGVIPFSPLLLYPIWGRLTASVVATQSYCAREGDGLGYNMIFYSGQKEFYAALFVSLIISLFFGLVAFLCAIFAALLGLILCFVWRKALGGATGDILGASLEIGEMTTLLFFALFAF
ncbi:MAG: adenosylcobinamide-GDP ribazoletransferase [Deltaproteobacteria bacterium]|jgi:cobalamin 5'-phosphate synthase/cobalamin synthase|nr:adenosylcobinamide-GDP ribazoletransferase [Deltaproteobacteria bacterium]